ncbi:MAG: hypothetical protein DRQ10_02075 [Candidatus Hydrothermota bacterium]|nr:MAG: hypothetical protein DRQ10_02075 [Candidatus Hydrothermae bacterium]
MITAKSTASQLFTRHFEKKNVKVGFLSVTQKRFACDLNLRFGHIYSHVILLNTMGFGGTAALAVETLGF